MRPFLRSPLSVAAALWLLAACGVAPSAQAPHSLAPAALADRSARYQNPVLGSDFADPCVLRAADGRYYAYATQGPAAGGFQNIACLRSDDLVHWTRLPDALPTKPAWAHGTQNFWAPHVIARDGRYLMYFAAQSDKPFDGHDFAMGLGVATSAKPEGPFEPLPTPITVEADFSAIDAFVMEDPANGKPYMFWGSGFKPLRARELTDDGLAFAPGSRAKSLLDPRDKPLEHLIEGSWIQRHGKYFYLYYSGDNCCTGDMAYAVMVARSTSLFGPYERRENEDGTAAPIMRANERWRAPGHNAVVTDGGGTDWLVYYAVDARQPTMPGSKDLRRCLMIDKLRYVDGWPNVEGGSPSQAAQVAPKI
ncbi:MAG: glycoside hydrolase [Cyanobacteria bacterium RYN_339]|nr:glycoside hydrolase [Cyanobacteria bacterium RYN_339]